MDYRKVDWKLVMAVVSAICATLMVAKAYGFL
jgi:hypothetical protein